MSFETKNTGWARIIASLAWHLLTRNTHRG